MDGEGELLAGLRAGSPAAFVAMVNRYNRRLYRVARAVLRDEGESEDVVQETYLRAVSKLATFRGEAPLGTWLVRIALHEAFARARRRGRMLRLGEGLAATIRPQATPERCVYDGELRRVAEAAIDGLPETLRLVLVLRLLEGMSVAETARALGLSRVTVKVRLFRARAALRHVLEAQGDLGGAGLFDFGGARCGRLAAAVLALLIPARRGGPSARPAS